MKKQERDELLRQADQLANQLRQRVTNETTGTALQLRELAGDDPDPLTARLLEDTLDDLSRLPDYQEALFRRRVERVTRPPQTIKGVIIGRVQQVKKLLPQPTVVKKGKNDER